MSAAPTILHVDMDAFYASIEQRDNPALRGQPVIVGGIGNRGVVCAASYEARPFGVRSALPMSTARRLCPQGIFLPVRIKHYAVVGRQVRDILLSFTERVEPLSLDEAFLDVGGCELLHGPAPNIARQIKDRVKAETDLIASVGVAPNKFLAKLASDHGKPDGLVVLRSEDVTAFLNPLPVSRLWGVGSKGTQRLHALGIKTVGQLAARTEPFLVGHFGEFGRHIWNLSHGRDERTVTADREAKSVSTETTFHEDLGDRDVLRNWLLDLTDELASRLRRHRLRGKVVDVKVRSSDFRTRTRSLTLEEATDSTEVLWKAALELFNRALTRDIMPVRLLGVGASRLTTDTATQGDLFDGERKKKQQALDRAVDAVREQFGKGAVQRGSLLDLPGEPS